MRAFNAGILNKLDQTVINIEVTKKEFVLLFSYGANLTPTTLLTRLLADWEGVTFEMLEEHFLGYYKVQGMSFAFNKRSGSNEQPYTNANIFAISAKATTAVYGSIVAVPKTILLDGNSNLNRNEGCKGIIATDNTDSHYVLRQLPFTAMPIGEDRHPSLTNGKKTIDEGVWFYQAASEKKVSLNEDGECDIAPKKDYAERIYNQLKDVQGIDKAYLDKIKKYI